ncbi:unnamed protein product [Oikopleura dioica]|uniref:Thymidine kinase n=1 Tax=Oikopleura dioica TaxID=34765 RepID=E4WWI8_OIKDI|nr:unnamed protein product [Oikopleura dioica]CBY30462.1 unnamed protein product [Oikopleura dioica]
MPSNGIMHSHTPSKTLTPLRNRGQIQLIIGPMFSGKSTELLRRLRRSQNACFKCLVVKFNEDDRYSDLDMATHDGQKVAAIKAAKLDDVYDAAKDFDVIGVDEGQFFEDLLEFCENLANSGKTVIVAALDGDYKRQPFEKTIQLIPLSESVTKLTAICMNCRADAAFSRRLGAQTQQKVIGGEEKYMAVCRACFNLPDITSPHKVGGARIPFNHKFNELAKKSKRQLFNEEDEKKVKKMKNGNA